MDNGRRVEIRSVTLLLFVAIVTSAGPLLQDVDKGFASFLALVYGIDIFCVVFYFIMVELSNFKLLHEFIKSNKFWVNFVDVALILNLIIVNFSFLYLVISALIPSYRQVLYMKLYGFVIGENIVFSLFVVVIPIVVVIVYIPYLILYRLYCWLRDDPRA